MNKNYLIFCCCTTIANVVRRDFALTDFEESVQEASVCTQTVPLHYTGYYADYS